MVRRCRSRPALSLDFQVGAVPAVAVAVAGAEVASRSVAAASQDAVPVSEAASVSVVPNDAPTDITVAGGSVQENAAAGTVVATLGAVDPNTADTFSYALTSDPSGYFEVVGNEVRVKAGADLDYETATSHDITVTVTDADGLSYSEVISIAVTNQSGTIVGTSGERRADRYVGGGCDLRPRRRRHLVRRGGQRRAARRRRQ